MKKYLIPAVAIGALIAIFVFSRMGSDEVSSGVGADPANTTYVIEGESVRLIGGASETAVTSDSSSTVRTMIFGNPVVGDLDGDTDNDMVLLLQRETGGSGTFYYLVAALQNADMSAQGTNAIFIGDRIAPQNMRIVEGGTVEFNYADRAEGEPMTAQPSVGVTLYAAIEDGVFVVTDGVR